MAIFQFLQKVEFNSAFFASKLLKMYVSLAFTSLLLGLFWKNFDLPPTTPQGFGIAFYQHVLGHLDGRACPTYPVCSAYAREAIQTHGALVGSWLMIDRLIHETGDLSRGPWINWKGEKRLYDPLKRNDFWLENEHEH